MFYCLLEMSATFDEYEEPHPPTRSLSSGIRPEKREERNGSKMKPYVACWSMLSNDAPCFASVEYRANMGTV